MMKGNTYATEEIDEWNKLYIEERVLIFTRPMISHVTGTRSGNYP